MQNILVTGSYGQLGCEIRKISKNYPDFTWQFHDLDTLDITVYDTLANYFRTNLFDFIINCASYTQVDLAEKDPETAYKANVQGPENLSKLAQLHAVKLIHISTDYVFDGKKGSSYLEDDTPNPLSVYGKTKLKGEEHVLSNGENIVIRTSWLYSSFGNNFVKTMVNLSHEKESIKVVSDQVGSPTYAGDLAEAILNIISAVSTNSNAYKPGIFHYSNEGSCSWHELAQAIVQLSGTDCTIIPIKTEEYPLPAERPPLSVMDKEKIKSQYHLQIPEWKESLAICLEIIQKRNSTNGNK